MGPYGCTSVDTQYLTPSGWKSIGDYTEGDLVAQWHEDGKIEFVKPYAYIVEPCEEFWHFTNAFWISMVLSDEHRMVFLDKDGAIHCNSARNVALEVRKGRPTAPRFIPSMGEEFFFEKIAVERVPSPDGKKYCFSVPTGYFVARHDDRIFVTGNSGKSTACIMEAFYMMVQQHSYNGVRRSVGAVVRNTYSELRSTTIKTWQYWLPPPMCTIVYGSPIEGRLRTGLPDGTTVEGTIYFLPLDRPADIGRVLSLDLTWAWVNEAKQVPWVLIDELRKRMPRYPPPQMGGANRWGMIMDTNPPPVHHWYYEFAEVKKPEGWTFYRQPGALIKTPSGRYIPNPAAENIENLSNRYSYYFNMLNGADPQTINVNVLGEYGNIFDGMPVYDGLWADSLFVPEETIEPYRGMPLYFGVDFGLCYSDDTEVLTDSGWKFFKDVDDTIDLAATRNPENGNIEYSRINMKIARPYKGDMLQWSNSSVDFCVTPEHRVPFTHRATPGKVHFVEAQWLADHSSGHHYVDLCANWPKKIETAPMFGMDSGVFAEFMGYYLSEGGLNGNRIGIFQHKEKNFATIETLLNKTGRKWNKSKKGWFCSDRELAPWLRLLGLQPDRRVPREILNMGGDNLLSFLMAYTLGDGHVRSRPGHGKEHTCFTTSEGMAGDLQEIALKLGWNASIRVVKPQASTIVENGVERVIQNTGGFSIAFKKRAKRAELLKSALSRVQYDGNIYCLNVPHHTLYVRRNGRAHWNGNTPCIILAQLYPGGRLNILREFQCKEGGIRQLVTDTVLPTLARDFQGMTVRRGFGDPAGRERNQANIYAPDCYAELVDLGMPADPVGTNTFVPRRQAVVNWMTRMISMKPAIQIDKSCRLLIEGFQGAYHFRQMNISGVEARYTERPEKNRVSHAHDALQYLCMGLTPHSWEKKEVVHIPKRRTLSGMLAG